MPRFLSVPRKRCANNYAKQGTLAYIIPFYFVRQKGSHIVLKRPHPTGTEDVIVLPNHKEIDKWTLGDSLKLGNVGIDEFLESL